MESEVAVYARRTAAVSRGRGRVARAARLFWAFAAALGCRWDSGRDAFVHPDGSTIVRADRPFHWCRSSAAGQPEYYCWVAAKRWGQEDIWCQQSYGSAALEILSVAGSFSWVMLGAPVSSESLHCKVRSAARRPWIRWRTS